MLGKTKGQGGITLVALVVTIVVLLILAGITIALVFAQNGVVGKAQEAAADSNKGTIADNIQGYVAVSDTHLDVYKRQTYVYLLAIQFIGMIISFLELMFSIKLNIIIKIISYLLACLLYTSNIQSK